MSDILQLSDRQKQLYKKINDALFLVMKEYYTYHKNHTFALLLSGGYDSRYVLYMCKELNIHINCCYTFSFKNYMSTDAKIAEQVTKEENVNFKLIELPEDYTIIVKTMELLAKEFKCITKTDFECTFPLYYAYKQIKEDIVLTGTDADCYFALGRSYGLHYKNKENGLAQFRYDMFNGRANGQLTQRTILSEKYDKFYFDPFYQFYVRDVFTDTTWDELNVPYKKGPLYVKFKNKFDAIKPYRSSYQCGDSYIREMCANALFNSKYNKNYKSVVGCYNEILRTKCKDGNSTKLF